MYRRAEGCQRHVGTALPVVLLAAAIQLYSATAQACKCLQQSPAEAYEQAVSVFEGHVIAVAQVPQATPEHGMPRLSVRFSVVRRWKGMEQEQVVLTTATDGAACGYPFAADGDYLVYASSDEHGLTASLCSRTRPVAEADEDVRVLGMGVTPVEPRLPKAEQDALQKPKADEPPARGGCASCAVRTAPHKARAWALASCGLALVLAFRRRRSASRS